MVASSGMAAISASLMAFLKSGDHMLIQNICYGGTYDLVTKNMPAWGISHTKIDPSRPDTWRAALKPSTKVKVCSPAAIHCQTHLLESQWARPCCTSMDNLGRATWLCYDQPCESRTVSFNQQIHKGSALHAESAMQCKLDDI